ncbi:MAG: O-antigen ligase family protein [Flavobacteriales bacterium]|nr:O-antigen ligase family protein [Flavobacteriales bacterium]
MSNVIKYLAFIFLLNNIFFGFKDFNQLSENSFLIIMGFSLLLTIYSIKILKNVVFDKSFKIFFFLNFLNLIYYLFIEIGDLESLKYLAARFVQFSIFSISVYLLQDDFANKFVKFLKFVTIGSLLASLALKFPDFESRYQGIFFNPNEFSIIMVIGFALILFTEKRTTINYSLMLLFLFVIVISGSRSAIAGLGIAIITYILHHKSRNLLNIFFIVGSLLLFSFFGGQNNAIQRMLEFDLLINRKYEYLYAIDTFLQKPLFGHGLKNYAYIDFSLIQFDDVKINFGAHNGYISILVQYGAIFSTLFFSILIYNLNKIYRAKIEIFGENILQTKFLFFLITYALFNGLFENTIIGINFFQTNLFWLTLAYFLYVLYQKDESNSISD